MSNLLAANFSELNLFECGKEKCSPNKDIFSEPMPYHRLHYVMNGKGTFILNENTYNLVRGDIFYIPPMTVVHYYPDKVEPWEYAWVGFGGDFAKDYLSIMRISVQQPIISDKARAIKSDFNNLADTYHNSAELDIMCLSALLSIIYKCAKLNHNAIGITPKESYIMQAKEFVACNYQFNITVQDIASSLGLTPNYLANIFDEVLGESPKQYLIRYRMQRACSLLKDGRLNIKEVGEKVGYKNQLHFSAEFKRIKSLSPLNYKKSQI